MPKNAPLPTQYLLPFNTFSRDRNSKLLEKSALADHRHRSIDRMLDDALQGCILPMLDDDDDAAERTDTGAGDDIEPIRTNIGPDDC